MIVFHANNAGDALAMAMEFVDLSERMEESTSRNGTVLVADEPVTTVYEWPMERVVFWPERDANPFFHLTEALWMLRGSNDVATMAWYIPGMADFSDDGEIFHGAYGYRWRNWFDHDQLDAVVDLLREQPDTRRAVVQMWDARRDQAAAASGGRDVPCNLVANFQINSAGFLDMTVFCRSNDIIWGAYGANAVHFGFLLEYMALRLDRSPGRYWHISDNWHVYVNPQLERCLKIIGQRAYAYEQRELDVETLFSDHKEFRHQLAHWFSGGKRDSGMEERLIWNVAAPMKESYGHYKDGHISSGLARLEESDVPQRVDWIVAAKEWLTRRLEKKLRKEATE